MGLDVGRAVEHAHRERLHRLGRERRQHRAQAAEDLVDARRDQPEGERGDAELRAVAPGGFELALDQLDALLQVLARRRHGQRHAVGDLRRELQHPGTDRHHIDRRRGTRVRVQLEVAELADEQLAVDLASGQRGAQRVDEVARPQQRPLDGATELGHEAGVADTHLDPDAPRAHLAQRGELHGERAGVAARGRQPDEADLQPLRRLEVHRARHDRVVEAQVLGGPDAVEAEVLGGAHRIHRALERAEARERQAQPHATSPIWSPVWQLARTIG